MCSSKDDKKPFSKVERNSQLLELVNAILLNANLQKIYGVKPYLLHITFIIEYHLKN